MEEENKLKLEILARSLVLKLTEEYSIDEIKHFTNEFNVLLDIENRESKGFYKRTDGFPMVINGYD